MLSKNKIKQLRQLHQKKHRDLEGKFLIEGKKMVEEAILYHTEQIALILTSDHGFQPTSGTNISFELVDKKDIKKVSALSAPQEYLAVLKKIDSPELDILKIPSTVLALDSIRDPGNLGTIIRLADWYGIENIICSNDTVDCYNPKVVQATMGAILRVNMHYCHLPDILEKARNGNKTVYGALLEGNDLYTEKLDTNSILVMGNESEGISALVQNQLTHLLRIPNFSKKAVKTESLNVSIATSIFLSEIRRQENYSK